MKYSSQPDMVPTVRIIAVFSRFAHFSGSMAETMPENMDNIMEKKGTFCTSVNYSPSFRRRREISSKSSV